MYANLMERGKGRWERPQFSTRLLTAKDYDSDGVSDVRKVKTRSGRAS